MGWLNDSGGLDEAPHHAHHSQRRTPETENTKPGSHGPVLTARVHYAIQLSQIGDWWIGPRQRSLRSNVRSFLFYETGGSGFVCPPRQLSFVADSGSQTHGTYIPTQAGRGINGWHIVRYMPDSWTSGCFLGCFGIAGLLWEELRGNTPTSFCSRYFSFLFLNFRFVCS